MGNQEEKRVGVLAPYIVIEILSIESSIPGPPIDSLPLTTTFSYRVRFPSLYSAHFLSGFTTSADSAHSFTFCSKFTTPNLPCLPSLQSLRSLLPSCSMSLLMDKSLLLLLTVPLSMAPTCVLYDDLAIFFSCALRSTMLLMPKMPRRP